MTVYKLPAKFKQLVNKKYWEQTGDQLGQLVKSESVDDRKIATYFGRSQDLDILVSDVDPLVRVEVAQKGRQQDLDILVSDPDELVRSYVASVGRSKDLDVLIRDKSLQVRAEVASVGRGQDLEILARDPDPNVRAAVAAAYLRTEQWECLRKFLRDDDQLLRDEVKFLFEKQEEK